MSQHEPTIGRRADLIQELACVRDEMASAYTQSLRSLGRLAAALARYDELILAVAPRPDAAACKPLSAEPTAPVAQDARPPGKPPVGQSEGQPVKAGNASDDRSVGVPGDSPADRQSEEFVTVAGAGEGEPPPRDPAPAPDEEPLVPRREIPLQPPYKAVGQLMLADQPQGRPRSSNYDRVLDLWATKEVTQAEIASDLGITQSSVNGIIHRARKADDERALTGDKAREEREIAVAEQVVAATAVQDALIIADVRGKRIISPTGEWKADRSVVKAISPLADGQLYGLDRMARAGAMDEKNVAASLGIWAVALREIGVDLVFTKGIGCKLNRREVA